MGVAAGAGAALAAVPRGIPGSRSMNVIGWVPPPRVAAPAHPRPSTADALTITAGSSQRSHGRRGIRAVGRAASTSAPIGGTGVGAAATATPPSVPPGTGSAPAAVSGIPSAMSVLPSAGSRTGAGGLAAGEITRAAVTASASIVSSAARTSSAVAGRPSGARAISRRTSSSSAGGTTTPGARSPIGGGSSVAFAYITSTIPPSNGTVPASSS